MRTIVFVALLLAGCGSPAKRSAPAAEPSPSASAVARWLGGELSFEELERRARPSLTAPRSEGIAEVLAIYRRTAEEVAVLSLLEADTVAVARVEEQWRPLLATIEMQAVAEVYAAARLPRTRVTESEIEAHYRDHPDAYRRPERREVLHVFKRDRPEADAMAALAEVRRRAHAGERFRDLARDASDSETRLLERGLGWVARGVLPATLERVVFSLSAGEVSQPVRVAGGGVLFYVTQIEAEELYALADVRRTIVERLAGEKIEALLADQELPADAEILTGDAVVPGLAQAAPGDVVLAGGDYRLTAAELAALFAEQASVAGPPSAGQPDVVELYRDLARALRLSLEAQTAGWPEAEEERQAVNRALRLTHDAAFRRKLLEDAVRQRVGEDEAALRALHASEGARYSSSLALELRTLILTDLSDVATSMGRLEELHRRSAAGQAVDLEAAAAEIGATVKHLGWVDFAALQSLPQKVRIYLFEVSGTGFTIPFQLGASLRMIEVVGRREPRPLSFEEARGAVARDVFARQGQEIYRRMVDEMLGEVGFEFDEATIRARLAPIGD